MDEKEKLNSIEEDKANLYNPNYKVDQSAGLRFGQRSKFNVPEDWQKEALIMKNKVQTVFTNKTSFFKKFFFFSLGFFVLAMLFAAYIFFGGGNTVSNKNIEVAIFGSAFASGGEPLPLQIEIVNKNTSALLLTDIVVEYPRVGTEFVGDLERVRFSVGTIPARSAHTENINLVIFGEQGSVKPLRFSVEYRVDGSNAIFVKNKDYSITISSAPVNISVQAPLQISPNQEFELKITNVLNINKPAENVLVRVEYPLGFEFVSAMPSPVSGNNVWSLGDLTPGSTSNITIVGKMVDVVDGENKAFQIFSGNANTRNKYDIAVVFNSIIHNMLVEKPFVSAVLYINGSSQKEYSVEARNIIQGEIRWVNNLPTRVNDIQIKATLSGNALNKNSIVSRDGFYNSAQDAIIWDRNSNPIFSEVAPGQSGSVNFSFSPTPLFSGSGGMLSEPIINIDVSVNGREDLSSGGVASLKSIDSKKVKIISDVALSNKLLYSVGPFTNTGPVPAKVETPTTYTVVWSVSNTSNSISNAQVRGSLPPWVKFLDRISPVSEDLSFNPSSREVVWNIEQIPRGTGINNPEKEVSFQVEFNPSLSQVGTAPTIVNALALTGFDDFAKVEVRLNKPALTPRLINDPAFSTKSDIVIN
jgi:hypothetical protein